MPSLLTLAAFGAGLVATLVLAAFLTPRAWWRRANLRALAVLAGGTLAIGSLLAWLFQAPAPAQAAHMQGVAALDAQVPLAGRGYRTYDDLNLRSGTGVGAQRVAVVPAGASVSATGVRRGDWWEVETTVDGRRVRGWVSSLWLRRVDEHR